MEEHLDKMFLSHEYEQAKKTVIEYFNTIQGAGSSNSFRMTQPFLDIFGEVDLPEELSCSPVTNIDMVFANVIITDVWNIIDYEWTFDFPIPINYVLFRVIHYYLDTGDKRSVVRDWNLYEVFGIQPHEIKQYIKMEAHFQKHIEKGHVPIRNMYQDITPGVLSVHKFLNQEHAKQRNERLQVFYFQGEEVSEEDSINYPMKDGKIVIRLEIPENTQKIRLDPGAQSGILTVKKLKLNSREEPICPYITNGFEKSPDQVIYETQDPQILILEIPEDTGMLEVELQMESMSEAGTLLVREMKEKQMMQERRIQELKTRLMQREQLIHEMENTKVWKAYQKVKGTNRKGK